MKINVYTIYDKLARESGPLFQAKNDKVAYRQFQTQLKEIKNIQKQDFELLNIAEYDNEACQLQDMITVRVDIEWIAFCDANPRPETASESRRRYKEYLATQSPADQLPKEENDA